MHLRVYVSLVGIVTFLLAPGFTLKPDNRMDWSQKKRGIQEHYAEERRKRQLNISIVDSRLEKRQEDFEEAEDFGIRAMNEFFDIEEPKLFEKGLFLNPDHPARYVAAFNRQSDEARYISKVAYAALKGSRKLIEKFGNGSKRISPSEFQRDKITWIHRRTGLRERCPRRDLPECTPGSLKYRTADGTCNNFEHLWWGSAMFTMQRFINAVYEDGVDAIRRSATTGNALPSARIVSTTIHEDKDIPLASITHMLMQWGQFVDHDVTATAQSQGFNGTFPQCCRGGGTEFQPPELMHPDCLPIVVDPQDNFFGRLGVRCLEFVRSGPAPKEDCGFGSREQLSQVTSYIDGSMIYSSNSEHTDSLRILRGGLLQYGKIKSRGPQFTRRESDDICQLGSLSTSCFRAGDARLTEQPALTSLHVVFLRLHNEIATDLSHVNPHWSDEKIFQEARKIIGASIQHITYHEFLPIILGPEVIKNFDLEPKRTGYYDGYNSTVNPNIANSFSTAAYRFGHSLVQRGFFRCDSQHRILLNNVSIHGEFNNRMHLHSPGSVDRLLLGLVNQPAQRRDEYMTTELTNHLFQFPNFPFGMDLAAINIQRGRDHGLPPYVQWREPCGLSGIHKWQDLERVMSRTIVRKFRRIYESVDDIDLFPAGIAEKSVVGGLVGPTFACIIAQQFSNLKKGDRFWYENGLSLNAFTPQQLHQIRQITLAKILCRTSDNIETIQPFVFLTPDTLRNERISCSDRKLSQWNIEPWIETRRSAENIQSSFPIPAESNIKSNVKRFDKIFEQSKIVPSKKLKPIQTNIYQKNRIFVKRPVGSSQDNVTIVVNNHAVNSPIFVNDATYGSNFHTMMPIDPLTTSSSAISNVNTNVNEGISPTLQHYPMRPPHPTDSPNSFVPVKLQDSISPNPTKPSMVPSAGEHTNVPNTVSNHNNNTWVNPGPLPDQSTSDWHRPSVRPPAIIYQVRVNTDDKAAKTDYEHAIPKPIVQRTNNNNDNVDDVTIISEKDPAANKELIEEWNDSMIANKDQDTESDEIPKPIILRNNGF